MKQPSMMGSPSLQQEPLLCAVLRCLLVGAIRLGCLTGARSDNLSPSDARAEKPAIPSTPSRIGRTTRAGGEPPGCGSWGSHVSLQSMLVTSV